MSNFLKEILGISPEEEMMRKQSGFGRIGYALLKEVVRAREDMTEALVDSSRVEDLTGRLLSVTKRVWGELTQERRGSEIVSRRRQDYGQRFVDADYRVVEEEK